MEEPEMTQVVITRAHSQETCDRRRIKTSGKARKRDDGRWESQRIKKSGEKGKV